MSRLISFTVLVAITLLLLGLFYRVLAGFFVPLFLSIVLVVVFRPLHEWLIQKTKGRVPLAAGITTVAILVCLLLPVGVVVLTASVQGLRFVEQNNAASLGLQLSKLRSALGLAMPYFGERLRVASAEVDQIVNQASSPTSVQNMPFLVSHTKKLRLILEEVKQDRILQEGDTWDTSAVDELVSVCQQLEQSNDPSIDDLTDLVLAIKSKFGILKTELHGGALPAFLREVTNPTQDDVEQLRGKFMEFVQPKLLPLTGATGRAAFQLIFGLLIVSLSLYFFLVDGPAMVETIQQMLPLDRSYQHELLIDFERTSRAVVLAMLAAAVVQGLTAGLGYAVAGMDYLVLLIMLTTIAALVPFVGPMVVWIPVCIYLAFVEERFMAAGLLALWGVLVVATVDNLVKAMVLHGQSQLHPLLALLSILGGVQTLGPIGIVVGPMAVSLLQTLLGIVRREMVHLDTHGFGSKASLEQASPNDIQPQTADTPFASKDVSSPKPEEQPESTRRSSASPQSPSKKNRRGRG